MTFWLTILIFILGLAVGSFLNVIICRLATGEAIVRSRSHCPKCRQVLPWQDLAPLFSFCWLRGRCRFCGQKISWQYPLVETATGLLFLLIFNWQWAIINQFSITNWVNLFFTIYIVCSLVVIFVYDLRHYIIPDKIIFPAIIFSVVFRIFEVLDFGHWNLFGIWDLGFGPWRQFFVYFVSAIAAAAFFAAIVLATRGKGMGLGDVKLALLMGLVLGWPDILMALFLAFFFGALVGIFLIIVGRKQLKSAIPFGPFLVVATAIVMFFGQQTIDWCFKFLGF